MLHSKASVLLADTRPILYLPIETKVRELHSKVLMASWAATEGFQVVLGEMRELTAAARYLPRGIFLDKGVGKVKVAPFEALVRAGHDIAAWCEEGLVTYGAEEYAEQRVDPRAMSMVVRFYAWGDKQQAAVLLKAPDAGPRILTVGNPRADTLNGQYRTVYADAAADLRARFGRFILINSNFAIYNNYFGPDYFLGMMTREGRIRSPEHRAFLEGWGDYQRRNFDAYVAMVGRLAEWYPEHRIIVRPHPSESHVNWETAIVGMGNVRIRHEGSAIPWIVAAEVMIHNTCTTGVEAFLLDRPAVTYSPEKNHVYDLDLPKAVSLEAGTLEALRGVLDALFDDSGRLAREHIARKEVREVMARNLSGNPEGRSASEMIAQDLRIWVEQQERPPGHCLPPLGSRLRSRTNDALLATKMMLARLRGGYRDFSDYYAQKFPGLSAEEINKLLSHYACCNPALAGMQVTALPGFESVCLIRKS